MTLLRLRQVLLLVALLSVCRDGSHGNRVLVGSETTLDTSATTIAVAPPFILGAGISALCLSLDSTTHVVELPHMVLRKRSSTDTAHAVVAMDRRTQGAISVLGDLQSVSGRQTPVTPSTYVSSHKLCFGSLVDSIAVVRLHSSERLRILGVAFETTYK